MNNIPHDIPVNVWLEVERQKIWEDYIEPLAEIMGLSTEKIKPIFNKIFNQKQYEK